MMLKVILMFLIRCDKGKQWQAISCIIFIHLYFFTDLFSYFYFNPCIGHYFILYFIIIFIKHIWRHWFMLRFKLLYMVLLSTFFWPRINKTRYFMFTMRIMHAYIVSTGDIRVLCVSTVVNISNVLIWIWHYIVVYADCTVLYILSLSEVFTSLHANVLPLIILNSLMLL